MTLVLTMKYGWGQNSLSRSLDEYAKNTDFPIIAHLNEAANSDFSIRSYNMNFSI